jgi:hypothetical protein
LPSTPDRRRFASGRCFVWNKPIAQLLPPLGTSGAPCLPRGLVCLLTVFTSKSSVL